MQIDTQDIAVVSKARTGEPLAGSEDERVAGAESAEPRRAVCHVLHGLGVGGAEVLAARLARRLSDRYRFVFVCLDELGTLGLELQAEGFPVHVLDRRSGVDVLCLRRLARVLQQERVDIVHAHQYTPFFYTLAARLFYRHPPVLFTEHGRFHPDYPRPKRILANRLLLERRDCVVGVGETVRQALVHNEGIAAERIEVIYNGIELEPLSPSRLGHADVGGSMAASGGREPPGQPAHARRSPEHGATDLRAVVRSEIGVGPSDLVIIQVARLDPIKDHLTALRALKRVLERNPHTRLVIVGEGPALQAIEQQVAADWLNDHVRLLGLRSDVARLLGAADICLLTSISEGIPLTLIEAMAAGVPVVATRAGGVVEVVEDERTGLLAPIGDDACLAQQILRLAEDPARRATLGRCGRERAEAHFSEHRMHNQYVSLYETMLRD